MFFNIILGVCGYFYTRDTGSAIIDDAPFRLYYSLTSAMLFLSTALFGLQDVFGKNINCYSSGMNHKAVNEYCWVTGTHLITKDNSADCFNDEEKCKVVHSYYQWVPYFFMLLAFLFYLPRLFWLKFEEGRISTVSDGVRAGSLVKCDGSDNKLNNVASNVANYIRNDDGGHKVYGMAFLIAQVWCLLNTLLAFRLSDDLLDGRFLTLGINVISNILSGTEDEHLSQVFPRRTSCNFHKVGSAGIPQKENYLCILAPNIIVGKLFTIFWFWFIILGIISVLNLLLLIGMSFSNPTIRKTYLTRVAWTKKLRDAYQADCFNTVLKNMNFGQFLFVYLLGRNVNFVVYKRILLALCNKDTSDDDDRNSCHLDHSTSPNAPMIPTPTFPTETKRLASQADNDCHPALFRPNTIFPDLEGTSGNSDSEADTQELRDLSNAETLRPRKDRKYPKVLEHDL